MKKSKLYLKVIYFQANLTNKNIMFYKTFSSEIYRIPKKNYLVGGFNLFERNAGQIGNHVRFFRG